MFHRHLYSFQFKYTSNSMIVPHKLILRYYTTSFRVFGQILVSPIVQKLDTPRIKYIRRPTEFVILNMNLFATNSYQPIIIVVSTIDELVINQIKSISFTNEYQHFTICTVIHALEIYYIRELIILYNEPSFLFLINIRNISDPNQP